MSWFKSLLPVGRDEPRGPQTGFQVLKNTNTALSIEPWFDFIVGINGRTIDDSNPYLFQTEIRNCAGRDVYLSVWSAKGQRVRDVGFAVPYDASALGMTLQWCHLTATEDVWHILDVAPESPADLAGFLPYSDYIIGTPEGTVRGEPGLGELVEDHMDRPLRLYVYNHEYDVTRELTITPTRSWGGSGALGCVLGFGALHRLPAPLNEPVQGPGETLFEARKSGEGMDFNPMFPPTEPANLITPALIPPPQSSSPALQPPPPPPPQGAAKTPQRKQRAHHAHHTGMDMNEYLMEGEMKSRELDRGSTPTPGKELPPPPKRVASGGSPKGEPAADEEDLPKDTPIANEEAKQEVEDDID